MPKKGKNPVFELAKFTAKRDLFYSEIEELYTLSRSVDTPEGAARFSTLFLGYEDLRRRFIEAVEVVNDLQFEIDPESQPNYELLKNADRWRCGILEAAKWLGKADTSSHPPDAAKQYRLPEITLPEFHGDVCQWPMFFAKFTNIIHNNRALDDSSKLHYLLGALKGGALEVCAGIAPTAQAYPVIVNALKARYENKRVLADIYFDRMLELKAPNYESAAALSNIMVKFDSAYKSLEGLELHDVTDFMMAALLLKKLDPLTRRAFETSRHSDIPSYAEVYEFLTNHINGLGSLSKPRPTAPKTSVNPSYHTPSTSVWKPVVNQISTVPSTSHPKEKKEVGRPRTCQVCGQLHQVYKCDIFLKMSPADRLKRAQEGKWCFNCLSYSHVLRDCKSKMFCQMCNKHHHTLLHLGSSDNSAINPPPTAEKLPACTFLANSSPDFRIHTAEEAITILPTAVVRIETPLGDKPARLLIDSGSQRNFLSLPFCRRFGLPIHRQTVPIEGLGSVPLQALGTTEFIMTSQYDPQIRFNVAALVTEKISKNLPPVVVSRKNLPRLERSSLADRNFCSPGPIDGILGAQFCGKILRGPPVFGPDFRAQALPTCFGYVIMGETQKITPSVPLKSRPLNTFCIFDKQELHRAVQRFWELEEVPKIPKLTKEEIFCEELFQNSTTRIEGSRYCVELPFKEFPPLLGDSRKTAENRFYSLERKFKGNPQFHAQYAAVVQDYLDQGHLSPVSDIRVQENVHFIPHFAVLKESSSTPLRIVFDASAKTSNSRSLNDVLFTGPKLQKDISQILLSFRISPIALLADIRQMYRNIVIHPKHRDFQQILWRNSPQEPLNAFQLNCVVFGVTSAPYLALRTVQQLTTDEAHNFPLAAKIAAGHMYVDDLVVSLESVPLAMEAFQQLVGLFKAGGFKLTKWATNSPEVLQAIPPEDRSSKSIDFTDDSKIIEPIKVLGLTWDSSSDTFSFKINLFQPQFTKRGILSVVARIWDPLGFLAPATLYAKLIIKEVWTTGLGWDDELPAGLRSSWQQFVHEIPHIQALKIPRYFGTAFGKRVTLVGFADSSEKGYGAVVYLRLHAGSPDVRLLIAKSRVAPQKVITLPKLELCAAVLLAELMHFCVDTLSGTFQEISKIALTDSTVTLAWIKNDSIKRETFVANRISAIERNVTPESWFHVRSEDNIADIISRGLCPAQLISHDSWIHGPSWLRLEPDKWPIQAEISAAPSTDLILDSVPSDRCVTLALTLPPEEEGIEPFLRRYSSFKRLLRVTVYILRFCKRLPLKHHIEPSDLETAEKILIRQVQRHHFPQEFRLLQSEQACSSRIRPLSPFLEDNLIRVGGRLAHSTLPYESKHPVLLPKNSHLTKLLIIDCHESNFHTGPNLVSAILRQKFWILSLRNLVRTLLRSCNFCFKLKPRPTFPPMADLPEARIREAKPFCHSGVDYAGPFHITISRHRGVKSQKAYLSLFICLVTKAVHLELASSLSSEAFLACFQRFVARRGPIECLYSDRGTNFVGARTELDKIHASVHSNHPLREFLNDRRIQWKFNPPLAPHFGGIWESNIRCVKTHLTKAIGAQILSYEELTTILTQVEALLNSRPLFDNSQDPAEPNALTPAHFLTLTPLKSLPLSEPEHLPLTTRKKLLDSIVRSFWRRWHVEYLNTLQARKKWTSSSENLKVGTVVVVRHDSAPPLLWPLGVIERLHPGPDGVVRVVTVRMGKNSFQRPVVRLCPLPSQ